MAFTCKVQWVLDGHKTLDPVGLRFAGVISWESVRITFTYVALNGLDVCAAYIQNANLKAPFSCKDYVICGPEFGLENIGKIALIHWELYGRKTLLKKVLTYGEKRKLFVCRILHHIYCDWKPLQVSSKMDKVPQPILWIGRIICSGEPLQPCL